MASRGVNKVILVGNLGKDPEIKYTPSGESIANLTLATSETWKDKNSGEQKELTEWHRVVAYGRLAQIMGEYLRKGSKVYVEGSLRTRKWQDANGNDRYTTEIRANEMQMLDGKGAGGGSSAGYDEGSSNFGGGASAPARRPQQAAQPQSAPAESYSDPGFDDDIPF